MPNFYVICKAECRFVVWWSSDCNPGFPFCLFAYSVMGQPFWIICTLLWFQALCSIPAVCCLCDEKWRITAVLKTRLRRWLRITTGCSWEACHRLVTLPLLWTPTEPHCWVTYHLICPAVPTCLKDPLICTGALACLTDHLICPVVLMCLRGLLLYTAAQIIAWTRLISMGHHQVIISTLVVPTLTITALPVTYLVEITGTLYHPSAEVGCT